MPKPPSPGMPIFFPFKSFASVIPDCSEAMSGAGFFPSSGIRETLAITES